MTENKQKLADELEQFLQAQEMGTFVSPAELSAEEAEFTVALQTLSNETEAAPEFVADLQVRLQARAVQLEQKKSRLMSKRPSFWHNLQQKLKDSFTMKYTYAFSALALVALLAFGAVFGRDYFMSENPAEPALVTEETSSDIASNIVTSEDTVAEQLALLPPLPHMNNVSGGSMDSDMAATSGLVVESESMLIDESGKMMASNPFADTQFDLNTTLPTDPVSGLVQQQAQQTNLDAETARQIADQLGFNAPLYTEPYGWMLEEEEAYTPPTVYFVFDGTRTLQISPWGISYTDQTAVDSLDYNQTLPFARASEVAETFLTEQGWLDFPYVIEEGWGNELFFLRVVDGLISKDPEIMVTVNQNGQIAYINDMVVTHWEEIGDYPLISAEQAWQTLLADMENEYPTVQYQIDYTEEPFGIVEEMPSFEDEYTYWEREYSAGSEMHFYEWLTVYKPVAEGSPIIKTRQWTIQADEATLNTLADNQNNWIHLWGTLSEDEKYLQLAGWEAIPDEFEFFFEQGVIRQEGEEWLFASESGEIYILPDVPSDMTNELDVYVFGTTAHDAGLAYPILDWTGIEIYIDYGEDGLYEELPVEEIPAEEPMPVEPDVSIEVEPSIEILPVEPYEPFVYESVQIEVVSLVYIMTYAEPTEFTDDMAFASPTVYLQPVWQFEGTLDDGDGIKFFIQAVADEYLQP